MDSAAPPACSTADLDFLVCHHISEHKTFIEAAKPHSASDYYQLGHELIRFRQGLKASLPRCAEALEPGLRMLATASDHVVMYTFFTRGIETSENP